MKKGIKVMNLKIVKLNIDDNTFTCDNGVDYPYDGDIFEITIEELQKQVDMAHSIMGKILTDDGEDA